MKKSAIMYDTSFDHPLFCLYKSLEENISASFLSRQVKISL